MISLLSRWTGRRSRKDGPPLQLTVYSRAQCGCCEKAMAVLRNYQKAFNLAIDVVDVDSDQALVALYGNTVPVVAIEGKVRFKGIVNPVLLERLLTAESQKPGAAAPTD